MAHHIGARGRFVPVKILLADPQALLREAICAVLEDEEDLLVVAEADEDDDAVARAEKTTPDVAFLGEHLSNPVLTAAQIKELVPECRIVILGDDEDDALLFDAVLAGATGYLTYGSVVSDLVETARAVVSGHTIVPSHMLGALLDKLVAGNRAGSTAAVRLSRLTRRERQVLTLLAKGADNDNIAATLMISPQTVRTHVQNVLGKLEVHSRLEAAALAMYLPPYVFGLGTKR